MGLEQMQAYNDYLENLRTRVRADSPNISLALLIENTTEAHLAALFIDSLTAVVKDRYDHTFQHYYDRLSSENKTALLNKVQDYNLQNDGDDHDSGNLRVYRRYISLLKKRVRQLLPQIPEDVLNAYTDQPTVYEWMKDSLHLRESARESASGE